MLIEVTRKCNEKCTHCMVDALPNGPEMDHKTFIRAVKFIKEMKCKFISLSGGDPFLHSEIFKMIRFIQMEIPYPVAIAIQSNGWWIEDEKLTKRIKKLLDNNVIQVLQISTHKDYYPNYEWTMSHKKDFESLHPNCKLLSDWQGSLTNLAYAGRAVNIMKEEDIKGAPHCLTWVSLALAANDIGIKSFRQLLDYGATKMNNPHTCTPYIDVTGKVKLGEFKCCKPIWDLSDGIPSERDLMVKCREFIPCNKCKALKNLSDQQAASLDLGRVTLSMEPYFINEVMKLNGGLRTDK